MNSKVNEINRRAHNNSTMEQSINEDEDGDSASDLDLDEFDIDKGSVTSLQSL